MIIQTKWFRFGITSSFKWLSNEQVYGICNRTEDGLYIPFIDYDDLPFEYVVEELRRLQIDFGLSTFYLIQSSKQGYHAICLDKLSLYAFENVLQYTSCDRSYRDIPSKRGIKQWTLRVTKKNGFKPNFVGILEAKGRKEKSLAHATILKKLYDIDCDITNNDKKENLVFAKYEI